MEFTRHFTKLGKGDAALAGGKGASLGEMTQAGIPVPPGFVVLSESFEYFIKETDLVQEIDTILHKVNHKEIHTVERASEDIRALILSREMPKDIKSDIEKRFKKLGSKYVAVRSSATAEDGMDHAWAGQLESYLNTKEDDVLTKVKLCWSSLFTPRAIFYRFEKGLHTTKISVAVVVQKMVESQVSGIAFSVHPVTEDYNQLIIEAGFGLGEAIVSGQVTPDSYVVEKEPRNILDINVSTQERALYRAEKASLEHGNNEWITIPEPKASSQVLTREQILELSEIILTIERHYGFPCDIEWAFEANKFYIVQSRPITTLQKKNLTDDKNTYPVFHEGEKLNWVKFLERKRTPFIYFPFVEIEAERMPAICDFRFYHHLYKWSGNTGVHFRVADELAKCNAHFLDLIKKKDPRIKQWAKKGSDAQNLADRMLKDFSKNKPPFSVALFDSFFENFIEVLLYTATMPYLVLSTIDAELTKGATRKDFEAVLDLYEPLRNTSKYPELERTILNTWFDSLGKKYKVEPVYIHFMTPEELRNIGHKGVDIENLKKRKDWSAFWNDISTNKIIFSFERGLSKNIPVLHEHIESTDTLSGTTAFPGYAKGTVRIINVLEDIKEFNQGDILVSLNTNPDLIPAIKKAGAIVTDEGGIMCHAAIVSREFKIPCVIGTKTATKVLKDGDVVEVDANDGTVRKLKSVDILQRLRSMKWEKWLERPFHAFVLSIFEDSVRKESFEKIGMLGVELKAQLFQKSIMYLHHESLEAMDVQIEEYLKNHSMFDVTENLAKYKIDSENRIQDLINSNAPIEEKFRVVFDVLKHCCTFIWLAHGIESFYDRKLKEMVPKYIKTDVDKFIGDASFPKKKNAHIYLEEMIRKGAPAAEVVKKYGWIKIRDGFSDGYTVEEIEKMKAVLPEAKAHIHVKIPNELQDLFDQIKELVFFRTARTDVFYELFYKSGSILKEMADKHNIAFNDMRYYRAKPFITGEAKKYAPHFSFAYLDGEVIFQDDPILPEDKLAEGQEIKGIVAYKGKVRGKVKVVKTIAEIDKVQVGDILVTQMTFPNFIPAMVRAIAFVTDEGGITCHAAIVAREMRKPCIIGTKIATRVLKDGDFVEVDAERGVVTILK